MVGTREHLASVRELVSGKSCLTDEETDVNKEIGVLKMDSGTSGGVDGAALTVSARLRGGGANEEGKKPVPSQHRSSPNRNYSQGSGEQEQEKQGFEKFRRQGHRPLHSCGGNSGAAAMETDGQDDDDSKGTTVSAEGGMDMDSSEAQGEVHQRGKEIPRCDYENLDSSPDYGRRESSQGNSRHICKYCSKEFSSGRALGGHMRAHGSLSMEDGANADDKADKHQLSGSLGHASQLRNNADSGSDHALSNSVKQEGSPPYSKRARNSKEIHSGRSGGGRRSKNGGKPKESTPKSSEEVDTIKHDEEENAVSMRDAEPSSSSEDGNDDDGGNDDGATDDAADNVCDVCDKEFENGKQLNSHKKSHGLYALRRNPKRSRRFIDQDYTLEVAASNVPAKKTSSMYSPDTNAHACTECGKRFQSWKALFGHMRCHPERNWRGIHRPDAVKDKEGTSSAERQLTGSRRKKVLPNNNPRESDSESDVKQSLKAASDNESDTESIEAAYMNGDRQQSHPSWIWMTGKRSKRSRQTVRSLQAVNSTATTSSPAENEMEHETAMGLMMLARKEGGKENWQEGKSSEEPLVAKAKREIEELASSETEGDELDEQLVNENARESDAQKREWSEKEEFVRLNKGKEDMEVDEASLWEENEEGGEEYEAGEQGAGSAKPKYVCNTCKRVFKSHQALGGHRASHKKVKGCFARTNVGDGTHENQDDETSEEFLRSEEQLPTEMQDLSQSEGDEKEKQVSSISKEDSGEMVNGSRKAAKGHICTICGRVFSSGQALGGHKRCHYNGNTEATSSTNGKEQLQLQRTLQGSSSQGRGVKDELVQQGGQARTRIVNEGFSHHHGGNASWTASEELTQSAAQARPMKEKCIDLNLPATDDDYDVAPSDMIYTSVVPKHEVNGQRRAVDYMDNGVVTSNFDADLNPKEQFYSLYHTAPGKYVSRVEESTPTLSEEGQEAAFRGTDMDFGLRYVRCNICNRQFSTVEALSNHQKTHASMMSSVSGLTPISA